MRAQDITTTLHNCLTSAGIQPSAFAFFLSEYVKKKQIKKKNALSILLHAQLISQAEIIRYHLRR
jgi:hypothetical protein